MHGRIGDCQIRCGRLFDSLACGSAARFPPHFQRSFPRMRFPFLLNAFQSLLSLFFRQTLRQYDLHSHWIQVFVILDEVRHKHTQACHWVECQGLIRFLI